MNALHLPIRLMVVDDHPMLREGIAAQSVMIEHNGALVDFGAQAHPY